MNLRRDVLQALGYRTTDHAWTVITERRLELEWIVRTLQSPDMTMRDRNDATLTRSYKRIDEAGRRILRVVHRETDGAILIVTAFFDRKAKL